MFTDHVKIKVSAGKGGNGLVAWRREKFIPKGGPCGGDGGKGGSIILKTTTNISSLDQFRHMKILKAENGAQGGPNLRKGKDGKDLTLLLPPGTLIKNAETQEIILDMVEPDQTYILCRGGKGGYGNDHFKSPTNRTPYQKTDGKPGEECYIELELELIADVGLVGFPNAGKSSLLHALARIRVKVGAYPFTTLKPNIGFIQLHEEKRLYIADIPGIIEGAHSGKGLGLEFLRHIERTKVLLFMLDASGIDGRTPYEDWKVLRSELKSYNPELLERPYLIALNKIDDDASLPLIKDFMKRYKGDKSKIVQISAIRGDGLQELVHLITSI